MDGKSKSTSYQGWCFCFISRFLHGNGGWTWPPAFEFYAHFPVTMSNRKKSNQKPSDAQRKAQSRRDKSRNRSLAYRPALPPNLRKRQGKNNSRTTTVFKGSSNPNEVTTISSAYAAEDQGIGDIKVGVAPAQEDYKNGTRIVGCEILCPVGTNSTNANVLGTPTGGSLSTMPYNGKVIPLFPALMERLQKFGEQFLKYVFREICVEYRPMVGTSTAGGFAIGWVPDAGVINDGGGSLLSFNDVASSTYSMLLPYWKPACFVVKMLTTTLRYTDVNNPAIGSGPDPSDVRLCSQGAIIAQGNAVPATGASQGYICIKYKCDFYGSCMAEMATPTSLSLGGLTHEQRRVIRAAVERKATENRESALHAKRFFELKQGVSPTGSPTPSVSRLPTLDSDGDWVMGSDGPILPSSTVPKLATKLKSKSQK